MSERTPAASDLSPNMRAIRLTMRIAELQLARGVGARDVVVQSLDITRTYCQRRVWFDVVASLVLASQDRGHDREPLTLIRTVTPEPQNNLLVERLQALVSDIVGGLPLSEAEARLEQITAAQPAYPGWVLTLANAGVAAGYALLFSTSWVVIAATFLIACLADRLMRALQRRATPPFFVQAAASALITLCALGVGELGARGVPPLVGVRPTPVIVGGVVMLVAGLTIYATAADAIDEFFITAGARFFKTFLMTAGIVAGILVGVSAGHALGTSLVFQPGPIPMSPVPATLVGAVVASVGWSLVTQSSRSGLLWAGVVGAGGWVAYLLTMGLGDVAAKGIGAAVVGFAAAVVTRLGKTPTIAIVDAALVPLVPGLALMMGLMYLTQAPSVDTLAAGAQLLLTALGVALSIAAGASLGAVVGRPLRRNLSRVRTRVTPR